MDASGIRNNSILNAPHGRRPVWPVPPFHKIRFGLRNQAREVALMKLFFLDYGVLLVALLMMAYKVFRDPDGDDSE